MSQEKQLYRATTQEGLLAIKCHSLAGEEGEALLKLQTLSVPVPWLLYQDSSMIIMDWLPGSTGFNAKAERDAAREIRRLHCQTGHQFGWARDQRIGDWIEPGCQSDSWWTVYRSRLENHILPLQSLLSSKVFSDAMVLMDSLPFLPSPEVPVLCHGDLWRGNILVQRSYVQAFIDPCLVWGTPDLDLAMLDLFGGVGEVFWQEYYATNDEAGTRPDNRKRTHIEATRPIYTLYYLAIHARQSSMYIPQFIHTLAEALRIVESSTQSR